MVNLSHYSRYGEFGKFDCNELEFDIPDISPSTPTCYWSLLSDTTKETLSCEFLEIRDKFGFQNDNMLNMQEFLASLLVSKMNRQGLPLELAIHSIRIELLQNYRIWQTELDFLVQEESNETMDTEVYQVCLFLCIWGESCNLRYCPELLCFLFHIALDFTYSDGKIESFLDEVTTPFYNFIRNQIYKQQDGILGRRFRDHSQIIGYDDICEAFWSINSLKKIVVKSGESLLNFDPSVRLSYVKQINFEKSFGKTFLERRTSLHVFVNFISIWNLHLSLFFYYLASVIRIFPRTDRQFLVVGFGGILSSSMGLLALLAESLFLPYSSKIFDGYFLACLKASSLIVVNCIIPVCHFLFFVKPSTISLDIALVQLFISVFTSVLSVIIPRFRTIGRYSFNSSIKKATSSETTYSVIYWAIILVIKSLASFFYLIRPFGFPFMTILLSMKSCSGSLCTIYGYILLALLVFLNSILFVLDTYIWYTVVMASAGVYQAFSTNLSIFTPWKKSFSRILEKISSGILNEHDHLYEKSAKIWNSIVASLYTDFMISKDQLEKLVSHRDSESFEYSQSLEEEFESMKLGPETSRRLEFLSQTLSCNDPALPPVFRKIPVSTVLIPHYSEKIILSLRDLIYNYEGQQSFISLLDYLKGLYPDEWENYVEHFRLGQSESHARKTSLDTVGFDSSSNNEIMRMRIWASLRSQTVFRTVSGFSKYSISSRVFSQLDGNLSQHLFNLVLASQNYAKFSDSEYQDIEIIMKLFPEIKLSFLLEEDGMFYSCLIDSTCEMKGLQRIPKLKIKLPGNPILGDGKSDNQNHSIIFTRGEVIQLIDANQDNYLEEAFKLRRLLSSVVDDSKIAILGTREFIFSQGVGVLGDVAAGKEYTFGTITQRVLAKLNARLHYGHPDFLNTLFMITRGGVSKGQKGLHLNEDIFAGMNIMLRGGSIKHSEYVQCGKGRDLGFTSILGFVAKIGSGMGEQMLSREQYYLGLYLPLDRLLSFYFSHPGFHMNNFFSILAIKLFMICLMMLVGFTNLVDLCSDSADPFTLNYTSRCLNQKMVLSWLRNAISAIVVVIMISFLPLFAQMTNEFGFYRAMKRIVKQIVCLSPLFEVFTTEIYAYSLSTVGWSSGGTSYISTGRGFSTYRQPFTNLFASFNPSSISLGLMIVCQLLFIGSSLLTGPFLVFFWFVAISLLFSPFIFNPRQFYFSDFVLDYNETLGWLFGGNIDNGIYKKSWISMYHSWRATWTGAASTARFLTGRRSHLIVMFLTMLSPFIRSIISLSVYVAYKSVNKPLNALLFGLIAPLGLIASGLVFCIMFFFISMLLNTLCVFSDTASNVIGRILAFSFRISAIVFFIIFVLVIYILEDYRFGPFCLNVLCFVSILDLLSGLLFIILIPREQNPEVANYLFWTGKLHGRNVSYIRAFSLLLREIMCKSVEFYHFGSDFMVIHILILFMFPLSWIPKFETIHDRMILWKTSATLGSLNVATTTEQRRRKRVIVCCSIVLVTEFVLLVAIISTFALIPLATLPNISKLLPTVE